MNNDVLGQDFEYAAKSNLPFERYRNSTFMITGATGLVGSLLIKNLLYFDRIYQLNLKVIGIIRNLDKAMEIYGDDFQNKALSFIEQDLKAPVFNIDISVDYIIHAASATKSKDMVEHPADNIQTAVTGTMAMLELARKKHVKSMVYISSMEVYGQMNVSDHKITENELGYIDLASPRSCYPEGKRMCECLCNAYALQYNLNVKCARLAQTFGAGILRTENRVFAQFAKSVINGEDIVLHTHGQSEGNYVYTADAVIAILLLLTEGKSGNAYNVSNENSHTTIAGMAEMVANKIAKGKIKVVFDIPEDLESMGYAPDVKMHLSSAKMCFLGWKPDVGLIEAYRRMILYMKDK